MIPGSKREIGFVFSILAKQRSPHHPGALRELAACKWLPSSDWSLDTPAGHVDIDVHFENRYG